MPDGGFDGEGRPRTDASFGLADLTLSIGFGSLCYRLKERADSCKRWIFGLLSVFKIIERSKMMYLYRIPDCIGE